MSPSSKKQQPRSQSQGQSSDHLVSISEPSLEDQVQTYHRVNKLRQRGHAIKRLAQLDRLQMLEQRITDQCPCGKHKGISFVDDEGKVVEEFCPVNWWVNRTWLALEKGTLKSFLASTTLDMYLMKFRLRA